MGIVEGHFTFDLLPNADMKAYMAWAGKASERIAS